MSLGWCPSETDQLLPNSLQNLLSNAQNNNFTFITVPIQVKRELFTNLQDLETLQKWQKTLIASSDRHLFDSKDWSNRVLFRISTNDPNLELLLEYAAHLTVFAVLIEDDWSIESVQKLMKMNQVSQFPFKFYFKCDFYDWRRWETLQSSLIESDKKFIGVVPELKGEPKIDFHIKIWRCEALKGLIIDESVFLKNSKGYPVLPRAVQSYLQDFMGVLDCPIILKCTQNIYGDGATYMKWLLDPERPENQLSESDKRMKMFVEGFENVLQTPLQPLRDHLSSETYEIFERDPIKYQLYEDAIEAALRDKNQDNVKIGIFGAGRGPLVQAALNAAEKAQNCRLHAVALEKSPNACLTLLDRFKSHANVEIVFGDMRSARLDGAFDIIVSELLGSFGDNELSPECLWPVEGFLKADGVFIPQEYTSYIEPCYAPILLTQVKELQGILEGDAFDYGYVVHVTRAMTSNSPLPVFHFEHPKAADDDGLRTIQLTFENVPPVVDGLIGYFDCKLYGNVRMSTLPGNTSSPGMLSWFPIYFPLNKEIRDSESISIEFKRCKDSKRVWYEWNSSGETVQNFEGRSFSINL